MAIIVIDAGHGGFDNGAMYQGRKEKDDNLRLALAVGKILERQGYDVRYTRTDDIYQSPYEKAQIANEKGADYFISFHRNSGENDNTYNGIQTLIYGGDDPRAERLANSINEELEKVGFANLGIEERTGLAVLRRTEMPAVLIETGFINHDRDNEIFDNNFNEIASAIAMGIEQAVPLGRNTGSRLNMAEKEEMRDREDGLNDDDGRMRKNGWRGGHGRQADDGWMRKGGWKDGGDKEYDDDEEEDADDLVFGVETGRFKYRTTANFLAEQLADQGFKSLVFEEGGLLHVVAGKEDSLEDALKLQAKLRELGYRTMIVALDK